MKFQIIPASAISETSYLSYNFTYLLFYMISQAIFSSEIEQTIVQRVERHKTWIKQSQRPIKTKET